MTTETPDLASVLEQLQGSIQANTQAIQTMSGSLNQSIETMTRSLNQSIETMTRSLNQSIHNMAKANDANSKSLKHSIQANTQSIQTMNNSIQTLSTRAVKTRSPAAVTPTVGRINRMKRL